MSTYKHAWVSVIKLMTSPLSRGYENFSSFTELAFLFVVFALGALFDPALPTFSIESQEYYLVSRTTLFHLVQPVYNVTITSVLTLVCASSTQGYSYMKSGWLQFVDPSRWISWTERLGVDWILYGMGIHRICSQDRSQCSYIYAVVVLHLN